MRKFIALFLFITLLLFPSVKAQGGLVSHWSFDNQINPGQDEVGANHGTLVNGPAWTPNGFNNGAIIFDGMDDYIDCGNDSSLNMGTGNFSISFWYKRGMAEDTSESIMYKAKPVDGSQGYGFLFRETGGNMKFTLGDGSTRIQAIAPSYSYRDTEWHHVTGVRGGGKVRLYMDAAFITETDDTAGSVDNIYSFVIGMGNYAINPGGPRASHYFREKIDEVKIFNHALTSDEINQSYYEDLASHREPPVITPVSPAHEETNVSNFPVLNVTVTDPDGDTTDVSFYGSITNASSDNFTIIALPDTQYYSETYPHIFTNQTQWIVDKRDELNIVFVTHEGDIVERWDNIPEWDNANASMSLLDGVVPWGLSPGNHDQETPTSFPHNAYYYNQYFNYTRFEKYPWYGGHYGDNNDNNYQLFTAGGMDFIIVHLEYNPSSEVLDWANETISNHSDRRAIVDSHYIIRTSGLRETIGNNIFNALKDNPNLFMILCGHRPGEARIIDVVNGKTIHTLLSDYQTLSSGGNGYLRIMTFSPKDNKIYVRTYSPYTNRYIIDSSSHFDLDYSMTDYTEIGTNLGVGDGFSTSMVWNDLANGTKYYWYASAVDSNSMIGNSEVWKFETGFAAPPPVNPIADIDDDGDVDIFDLGIVSSDFGKTSGFNPDADTDNSGEIDIYDLVFVAGKFTQF